MKTVFAFVGLFVSIFGGGCISLSSSRVQECTFAVSCQVNDEQGRPIPDACLFYGFDMPAREYLSWGGATMCQVAVADENGLICVDAVEVKDAGPLCGGWADLLMFIVAPGYAPVAYDGQSEVVLIKADEFEGVFYAKDHWRPYTRLKGADPYSRVPLEIMPIDFSRDVVTQGPGTGSNGEIARRADYFKRYAQESPFFMPVSNGKRLYVLALLDQRFTLAKRLSESSGKFQKAGSPSAHKIRARDYLEVRMKLENLPFSGSKPLWGSFD